MSINKKCDELADQIFLSLTTSGVKGIDQRTIANHLRSFAQGLENRAMIQETKGIEDLEHRAGADQLRTFANGLVKE